MHINQISSFDIRGKNRPHVNDREPHYWEANIGSGNGLGNKPLPEPTLIIFVATWHH